MAKTNWAYDPTHSEIGFKVKHMMFTNVSGKFNEVEVSVENEDGNFATSNIAFSAAISSIDTNNSERDNHLKSGDFFDAEVYPKMNFVSTNIEENGSNNYKVTGDLTIKDVTKPVVLDIEYSGEMKDPWGNIKSGLAIEGKINRKDFGLTWNAALETGGLLVGEDVKLLAEIQLAKQ
jgi:polyisoprenoid-binding protein YceI